jgi:hypothetical protein
MNISYYLARRILFTAFVSISLIAFGAALSAVSALDKYGALVMQMEKLDSKYASAEIKERSGSFWVREHEGIIGVFGESGELEYTVEIYIKTLPAKDRQLLKSGIYAQNREELLEILGDYNA